MLFFFKPVLFHVNDRADLETFGEKKNPPDRRPQCWGDEVESKERETNDKLVGMFTSTSYADLGTMRNNGNDF